MSKRHCQPIMLAVLMSACVAAAGTAPSVKDALQQAQKPVWSIKGTTEEFKVSVSPAGRTLRWLPRVGTAIGKTVDLMVNDKYRAAIRDALGKYDLAQIVSSRLQESLAASTPRGLLQVAPLGSTAGYPSERDAEVARLAALESKGVDLLMDLEVRYGIYGANFDLRFLMEGKVLQLPRRRRLWRGRILVTPGAFPANVRLRNIVLEQTPFGQELRLSVNKEAAATLTQNEAALLRKRFEQAVNGGVAALLCDMGLAEDGLGEYYLGRQAFQKKRFEAARKHFDRAMALDKDSQDIANDLAVTYAHQKQYDKAIELAKQILDRTPDYGPAAFNLAWWHTFEKHNLDEAARYYARALKSGIPPNKKLDRALKRAAHK